MSLTDETQNPPQGNIGTLAIDPGAEPIAAQSKVATSGKQEEEFYRRAGEEFRLAHNQQNLGVLGKFFGANSSAPTNIAGFVILLSFLIIIVSLFFPSNNDLVESRKILYGVISSALSFIFGAASKH